MNKISEYGEIILENVAHNLKRLRHAYNTPIADIAHCLGVTRQQYTRFENGKSQLSIVGLKRISDYYHVPIDTILNNHVANLGARTIFDSYHVLSDCSVGEGETLHIDNPSGSLIVMRSKETLMIFERLTNSFDEPGIYFFEYHKRDHVDSAAEDVIARITWTKQPSNQIPKEFLIHFGDDLPVIAKRKQIIFLGRLVGEYKETIPGKFIKK